MGNFTNAWFTNQEMLERERAMTDIVEAMARAIASCRGGDPDTIYDGEPIWKRAMPDARAALTVALDHMREPSVEAVEAFYRAYGRPLSAERWEAPFSNGLEAFLDQLRNESLDG